MKVRWLLIGSALLVHTPARADGRAAPCAERQSSALGQVACELAGNLPALTQSTHVVVRAVSSPLRVERADDLANRLARAVASELGPNARAEAFASTPKKLFPAARVDALVLDAELTRERFSVSAELSAGHTKFWERFRPGSRGTAARAHAARPLDAELAAHLPPVPLVLTRIEKARIDEPSVALACGEIQADGGLEIVSVGRRRIQVGHVARGRFEVVRSKAWSELSDVAPRPLKEPIASAYVDVNHRLQVGISDRSDALVLDRELATVARFRSALPWPNAGCVALVPGGVGEARGRCEALPRNPGGPLDALAGARLARRDGTTFDVFASRRTNADVLLEVGGSRVEAGPAGAQLALADLDRDGNPELVSSLDTLEPSADAIVVRTILPDGKLREAFRVPVPNGVRALGACAAWGAGLAPILVATGDELWVVR